MKLAKDALIEIIDIVRQGLATATDISENLRQLDLEVDEGTSSLRLTSDYQKAKGREEG